MANRWCDGLGRYGGTTSYMLNGSSGQAWAQVEGGLALSTAHPRTGNYALRLALNGSSSTGPQIARRVFGAQLTEVYVGFAVYFESLPTLESHRSGGIDHDGVMLGSFRDQANGLQCRLLVGTDGALELRSGTTVLGRSIPVIGAGAFQHIEMYAKAGDGDGAFEVRVDEVTRLNLTGIDNVQTTNVEFSQIAIGIEDRTAGYASFPVIHFADFFCNDTTADGSGCDTWLGDCKSGVAMVDADTAQADFTLSAGATGYTLLNGKPPDDATYISTSSSTAESDFGLADGPANMSEVLTVRPFIRAMKDDAGSCTVAPNLLSATTPGTVSDQPVTTAFAYYDSNVPLDPVTGVPWTPSGFNAAKHIVERTA